MDILTGIAGESWEVLLQSAPFMLFGFIIAGLLKTFVGPEFISRNLGSGNTSDVLKASILGVPIPLCSCGVIPAAAQLRQQGAGKGATTSFLISTPETGVDSIAVTYALLDPVMAVIRPFAAFFTAVVAGILVDRNEKNGAESTKPLIPAPVLHSFGGGHIGHDHSHDHGGECSGSCSGTGAGDDSIESGCSCSGCGCSGNSGKPDGNIVSRLIVGMKYSFGDLLQDIGLWFLGGVILAGAFSYLIPDGFIENNLGDGILSMVIMLVASVPLYVCATASTPIAAALALKGLSPGAALVFLLAGPATNAASFTVVARLLGKRSAFIYLGAIIGCSLFLGVLVNWLYHLLGLGITGWVQGNAADEHGILYTLCALILLALIVFPKVTALIKGEGVSGHSH